MINTARSLLATAICISTISGAHAADAPLLDNYSTSLSGVSSRSVVDIGNYTGTDLWVRVTFTIGNFTPNTTTGDGQLWPDFASVWLDDSHSGNSDLHTDATNIGLLGKDGSTGDAMIRLNNTQASATKVFGGSVLNAGQSFTILAHLYKDSSTNKYTKLDGWFNPDSSAGTTPTTTPMASATLGQSSIKYIGVRSNLYAGNSTTPADSVTVSSLSVGSTLASVTPVPEASSLGMVLAGLGMVGVIARRRIKA